LVGNFYGLFSSSGEGKTSLLVQIVDHVAANWTSGACDQL